MPMTVAAYTLGCKVNQYETEAVLEQFFSRGWKYVDFSERADVYLVNTCTVTSLSDRKSRQIIRRAKRKNPDAALVVTGCYAQAAPDELLAIPEVDLVLGTDRRAQTAALVEEFLRDRVRRSLVGDVGKVREFEELFITHYENRTRAFMKVQDGCNQFCSYCIIPYTRGRVRSRSVESVCREARTLAKNGFREIVLTGIHLASYGVDTGLPALAELIRAVSDTDGICRVRLGSLEPTLFTEAFTRTLAELPKLCHHFHLSLQSGCDATLARMNRKYTSAQYADVVARIRRYMPDAAVTTDIIVGFPAESDEEFAQTRDFVEKLRLSSAHIFKYSARSGTRAAQMDGQTDPQTKEKRSQELCALTARSHREFLRRHIGQTVEVLFEQPCSAAPGFFEGKTGNDLTVAVPVGAELAGKLAHVRLNTEEGGVLFGELIDKEVNDGK